MSISPDTSLIEKGFQLFMSEYSLILNIGTAFGVLTGVLAYIWLFMQLSASADNPKERNRILKELFMVGITTSLLGGITLITNIFYAIMLG